MQTSQNLGYPDSQIPIENTKENIINSRIYEQSKNGEEIYMSFTKEEWEHFFNELKLRPLTDENFKKAVNNARYLAMLDRGFKDMEEGNGTVMTFAELERIING